MIELYSDGSPNGHKISIALEELGASYTVNPVSVFTGEGQTDEFLSINPNGKIPVIRDTATGQVVTESNAILLYLAEQAGKLVPSQGQERWRAIELLLFQASTVGPMFGQRAHFTIMAPETIPYGMERYLKESDRINRVVDELLSDRPYFLSDYSIVDIAFFGWYFTAEHMGFATDPYPHLHQWYHRVGARPAVQRGTTIPKGLPELPPRKDLAVPA
ncbi:MAG: glutathione S-transferase family protein [Elainellaceae cyanobacterium]